MNVRVRTVLTVLAVAFTAYLAVGGMLWTAPVRQPVVLVAALVLYLVTTWLCIFWNVRSGAVEATPTVTGGLGRRSMLPVWASVLALATALVVPSATWFAAGAEARLEAFATWSLGGIGALMTIAMVRGRPWVAWIGVAIVGTQAAWWIGLIDALALGLVGAVVWVGGAQLVTWLLARAAADTAALTDLQRRSSEWLGTQDGRRRERRKRVQHALAVAGPVLIRVIETGGDLDDDERVRARLAEGELRDELRGPRLLDDAVRALLAAARKRGASVTVLDEGGLDGIDEDVLARIRTELARVLERSQSDRLYIRTSPHERIAVTVVGRSRPADDPDGEETVDLWHEIAHTAEAPPAPAGPGPTGDAGASAPGA